MMKVIFVDLNLAKQIFNRILDIFKLISNCLDEFKNSLVFTKFDSFRCKQIQYRMSIITELLTLIKNLSEKFNGSKSNKNFLIYIDLIIRNSINCIYKYNNDPFYYFPDINLKLLCNQKVIGIRSIKAHKVIWSDKKLEIGDECAKAVYSNIKVF